MGSTTIFVEHPRVVEEIRRVMEWKDDFSKLGQKFTSKEDIKDLVDRASQRNCFGIIILNFDTSRYVVKGSAFLLNN